MRGATRAAALSLVATLLAGCVYYNGMYNTKRLAGSARKAERDGRTFEANNLWGQVITRADTLVARHPDSKYVDEALVWKGVALSRLNQCESAVTPLGRLSLLPPEDDVTEEAALALGRCQLKLGDPAPAEPLFARVTESKDPARRQQARLLRARVLRSTGRHRDALAALEGLHDSRADNERLLALAGARQRTAALSLADSMLASRDSTIQWDSVVVTVGREDPVTASALVNRLVRRPGLQPDARARLFLEDGVRLAGVDSVRAEGRFRQAAEADSAGETGDRAQLRLTRLRLTRVTAVAGLPPLTRDLDQRLREKGGSRGEAAQLLESIKGIELASEAASAGAAQADLRLFLAAETARDSLAAPALAASLFRMMVETMPDSPYAPKAILAGQALDPVWGASALPLLEQRYAGSPYVAFLQGMEPYGYRELEDSLQRFASAAAAQLRSARSGTGRDTRRTQPDSISRRRRDVVQ